MVDIIHRVGIKAPLQKVYEAISTVEGISGWWTEQTFGTAQIGKTIALRFLSLEGKELGSMNMEVKALEPGKKVHWIFTAGPAEWIGTEVIFNLHQVATTINYVNCTKAPNCTALHRDDCSRTSGTCGACLEGFLGIKLFEAIISMSCIDEISSMSHSVF